MRDIMTGTFPNWNFRMNSVSWKIQETGWCWRQYWPGWQKKKDGSSCCMRFRDWNTEKSPALSIYHCQRSFQNIKDIIQTKTTFKRLLLKDILYIQKNGKNSIFVTLNGQVKLRKSLKEIYPELNHNEFIYIDKSCIVNIIHIMQIKNGEIILRNKESLSISRSHIQPTQKLISTFWGNHIWVCLYYL